MDEDAEPMTAVAHDADPSVGNRVHVTAKDFDPRITLDGEDCSALGTSLLLMIAKSLLSHGHLPLLSSYFQEARNPSVRDLLSFVNRCATQILEASSRVFLVGSG